MNEILVTFGDADSADANRYAEDLREQLLETNQEIEVERRRANESTMDFGATLSIVLAAPATIALAKALIAWVARNNRVNLQLRTKDGHLIVENLESKDAAAVLQAVTGK